MQGKAEKEVELKNLTECFSKAQVAVCADYRGLTVAQITKLRRELKGAGSVGKVVKNTFARLSVSRAHTDASKQEMDRFLSILEGPTLVVFSYTDPVSPTKVLTKFAKENEKFTVKGCWLDGAFVDTAGVTQLSNMPGREETFAMLLRLMSEPATRIARLIKEPGTQVARVVEAQRKKLAGE